MALSEKTVVIKFKAGPKVEEVVDGVTQLDADGKPKMVAGPPLPVMTATLRELSALDAMDLEDLTATMAGINGLEPSRNRTLKTYALGAVAAIDDTPIPRVRSIDAFRDLAGRLGNSAVSVLTNEYLTFAAEIATMADPKDSPAATP